MAKKGKYKAQKGIGNVWLIGCAILFCFVFFQTIVGKYDEKQTFLWGWFLPLTLPILTLMVAVLVRSSSKPQDGAKVSLFIYRSAYWASLFYLAIVFVTLILSSFTAGFEEDLLETSGLWLGPLQGVVGGLVGALFASEESA